MSGRTLTFVLTISFLLTIGIVFGLGRALFRDLQIEPEQALGTRVPPQLQVRNSIRSDQGTIVELFSNDDQVMILLASQRSQGIFPTKPLANEQTREFLEKAREYRITKENKQPKLNFITKYTAAQVDLRRTEIQNDFESVGIVLTQEDKLFYRITLLAGDSVMILKSASEAPSEAVLLRILSLFIPPANESIVDEVR